MGEVRGRCAEHLGLHDRTDECRRFMTLAFAQALGLEDLDATAAEKEEANRA